MEQEKTGQEKKRMRKIMIAAVMVGMTGGAYAAEFSDLAVRAADLKYSFGMLTAQNDIRVPVPSLAASSPADPVSGQEQREDAVVNSLIEAQWNTIGAKKVTSLVQGVGNELITPSLPTDKATSSPAGGPPPEFTPSRGLLLINFDGFEPVFTAHCAILAGLPADQKVVVVAPKDIKSKYLKAFRADFASGRFRIYDDFAKVWDPMNELYGNWARDFVPQYVKVAGGKKAHFVRFRDHRAEAVKVTDKLFRSTGISLIVSNITFQFGNMLMGPDNTLYTTERVLRANPGVSKQTIIDELKSKLNVDKVIVLPELPEESTGHIDMFAKFVSPDTVVVADSANAKKKKMLDLVASKFNQFGYKVFRVKNAEAGEEASVMSYANATILNNTIIIPKYSVEKPEAGGLSPNDNRIYAARDNEAVKLYENLGRTLYGNGFKIVQVPTGEIIQSGGSVHCLTRELPGEMPEFSF